MQLIVLGMHRSGTSVLARLLNLMGAYFGPEGASTGANSENPKGFWERRDVRNLNDAVLHSVDCDWNRIARFDVAALPPEVVARFGKHASQLILELDAHRPWLLKEPRLCLLLPLWRKFLEAPVCVHIYRNPVEVASSLQRRNGIPIEVGLLLWERYVRSALQASADLPRVVVSHRHLMEDPDQAAAKLLDDLKSAGVQGLRLPATRELSAFVEEKLYRERESRGDLKKYKNAPQLELFEAVLANGNIPREGREGGEGEHMLAAYEAGLPPVTTPAAAVSEKSDDLHRRLALKEQELQFVKDQCIRHQMDVEHRDRLLASHELDRQALREAVSQGLASIATREARLARAEYDLASLQDVLSRMQDEAGCRDRNMSSLEARNLELQGVNEELHARVVRHAETDERVAQLESELIDLERARDSSQEQVKALQRELMNFGSSIRTLEGDLRNAANDISRHRQELKLAVEAKAAMEQALEHRYIEVGKLTQLVIELEAHVSRLLSEQTAASRDFELERFEAASLQKQTEAELIGLRMSRSWRLTAPLRKLGGLLRPRARSRASASEDLAPQLELLSKSELFDEGWYLWTYPDVAKSGQNAAEHFIRFGSNEGRNPSECFTTVNYLKKNPDVAAAGLNPLLHYIVYGRNEGRELG
ncbi:hypothetical protein DX912_04835 [Lysobacter soli]|uniref:Sulfotransferase family protein n=1 Tax=Lysobacter soli TaxID=453783 RepID=A0A3D8VHD4_9GAMM|nr:sulfotransferase [Lysobacter soli]RDY68822.1 hypothetical protein DX912_04835 [Lysobacter soli]